MNTTEQAIIAALADTLGWTPAETQVAEIAMRTHRKVTERIFGGITDGLADAAGVGLSVQFTDPEWRKSKWFSALWGRTLLGLNTEQADMLDRFWSAVARAADFALEIDEINPTQRQQWLDETYAALFAEPSPFAAITETETDGS